MNVPSKFQNEVSRLYGRDHRCLLYMDDMIVYSLIIQKHIPSFIEVLKCLKSVSLKLQPDKYKFLRKEVTHLHGSLNQ